ncbi:PTS system D-fructose-specific IIA component (F1P-forming), Frc family /PTS system D-fructose-specific IIB component (F1P-forming), Frc family /PTS system D-fructose-specific IIC component (F1P-forming), Frc family [Streptomyces sp. ScaeMP-e48]|uniref:PTS fructose transporter subunit IIABC n=1 Tax=Streptomyces TaxID=1883 RepID=UPI0008238698|nr:fructose-specific PTS transporter subunit EIIC [Streptomyces sp. ScaeMP-e48]SCK33872.1 PTS system D-fructose-specific IIA component (F1P-forming), Frc family /PTS system D-fructose-specific IIB component (F1P-forming), Frc family /PTS system D-fructose-specific IIC component (F1P-forming), Frc family [Streptomyces sp. ScaeMP-e48]
MSELITAELVDLDLSAATKDAAARSLAERMVAAHRVTDLDGFLADVAAREAQMPTGLDGGIGIPHCRSEHVSAPTLAFGRSASGIDFGAADGPADLIFLIAAPAGADDDHLTILSGLARRLMDPEFTAALRAGNDPGTVAALIRGEEQAPEPEATTPIPAAGEAAPAGDDAPFRIVAVTSCPTGIAHTYMAAESLTAAGLAEGVEVTVETQGSAGFSKLDPAVIARADAVIWAHDVEVREKARFGGKPLVDVGVKAGINRPAELIAEARRKAERGEIAAVPQGGDGPESGADGGSGAESAHFGVRLRTYLMSGVSYMVPFVAAGGLLIALSFAIGGYEIVDAKSVADHFVWGQLDSWAALLNQIGSAAFGFLVPVLAGYIAYGMADRPALVPGFVGGAIALTVDAGFLGGLVAGLLAGAVVMAIQRVPVHATLRGIMPVLVIPLIASAVVGFLMFIVVGKPIAALQSALTDWLNGLSGSNAVILGVVLGLMMCFDMGGPLNKVAYAFAVGGLADPTDGSLKVMAAVMAAGMVPPLAMALATTVRKKLFTKTERENGRAAWVLGASFITEGAIPFAAADPLRVIPSVMAGGAVTGALSMAFECTLRAPHGGIFVVPLIGEPFLYLLAIAAGTLVATALVVLLKGARRTVAAPEAGAEVIGSRVGVSA